MAARKSIKPRNADAGKPAGAADLDTLPDLLRERLDVCFVGINPSLYSVEQGHYFARKTNRFWPAFSRSIISAKARKVLDVERLEPCHDALLLDHGFGFTDAVKRATARATDLSPQEFSDGVASLVGKIEHYRPKVVCFHGIMAYRQVHRVLSGGKDDPALGLQPMKIGMTEIFLAPNPSPANAHFTPEDQRRWYDVLAELL